MIEFKDIEKTYGTGDLAVQVLSGLSFHVEKGEYVAIMGPSGTGKTTLMNILGLLDRPTDGHYRIAGKDVVTLDDENLSRLRNQTIGFIFQKFHLLESVTVLNNVMLPLIYADEYPEDAIDRAQNAVEAVGLTHRKNYKPGKLSGGQQQRVAIARALVNNPDVLLADEPTGNLDSQTGGEILDIFKRLHEQGRTLVVITHDENVAERADRIIRLKDGRIDAGAEATVPVDSEGSPL